MEFQRPVKIAKDMWIRTQGNAYITSQLFSQVYSENKGWNNMSKHDILIADPIYITKQTRVLGPKSDSHGIEYPVHLYSRD